MNIITIFKQKRKQQTYKHAPQHTPTSTNGNQRQQNRLSKKQQVQFYTYSIQVYFL